MLHYRIHILAACLLIILSGCFLRTTGSRKHRTDMLSMVDRNLSDAAAQYLVLKEQVPPGKFPKTWDSATNKYEWSNSGWWCSGFYPGTLLQLYEQTKDDRLYQEAMRMLNLLEKEQYNVNTHDLGFMMFCSFGQANRLNPSPRYDSILVNSARSLSKRYDPVVRSIRSWNSAPSDFLVIIDNMMNLELLFWAARKTGDTALRNIAITHAETTIKNHFRPDYSSYHVVNYDPESGAVQQKRTAQGYSDSSAWARGQAWGLYGFTVMYRETGDKKYLDQATEIAEFIIRNSNYTEDMNRPNRSPNYIPFWDFNAPDIPNALRDASAAAITASALFELYNYVKRADKLIFRFVAENILEHLSSAAYRATNGTNGGFLLKHGVGHYPNKTEVDVPLTYADYYFVEAMLRYKKLKR